MSFNSVPGIPGPEIYTQEKTYQKAVTILMPILLHLSLAKYMESDLEQHPQLGRFGLRHITNDDCPATKNWGLPRARLALNPWNLD